MKQEDRFFRLMHAVDDDLLEEAMQPVRRRRHIWIPLAAAACLCIAAALAAVPLLRAPARQDVQPDGTQKQSGTSATEAAVPSSGTTDAKTIMDLGYTLAVPADSQDVVYSLVPTDSDIPMAQVCYVSNGISYTGALPEDGLRRRSDRFIGKLDAGAVLERRRSCHGPAHGRRGELGRLVCQKHGNTVGARCRGFGAERAA